MAKFDVDVGGSTYEVDAPDENTAWKWANATHSQAPAKPTSTAAPMRPLTKDNPNAIDDFLIGKLSAAPGLGNAPDIQGSIPGRLIQGAADMPVGALQLGANALGMGGAINQKIKEINDRTEALRGPNAGFDWSRLAGNVASPGGLALAAKVPLAATRIGKIGQGSAIGAVGGATAPVTDGGEDFGTTKAIQTAAGVGLGAAFPAVSPLVTMPIKAGYNALIEPWANPAAIKGRAFLEAAGDKADDIIAMLRGNKQMVPGSKPTAGEAAAPVGSAEFSALQKQASEIAPTPYAARADEQNAARLSSLRTVGQDEAALKAAEGARKAVTDPMYSSATAKGGLVDTLTIKTQVDNLLSNKPGNAELVSELGKVRKGLLYANGQLRTDAEQVSSVIDGLKTAIAKEDNKFIAGTLRTLQKDLEKAIPGYESAQKTFRKMSEPVNQIQVGQYLEGKLVPALADDAKQKAATFAGALRDAPGTIKRATGAPRYEKLEQVFTPEQVSVVNGIRDDLARGARFTDLARKGSKAAPDIQGSYSKEKIPGMLNRGVMIANAIISRLEGKVNRRLAAEIASDMLDPPKVGETMAQAQARSQRVKAATSMIEKSIQTGTLGAVNTGQRTGSDGKRRDMRPSGSAYNASAGTRASADLPDSYWNMTAQSGVAATDWFQGMGNDLEATAQYDRNRELDSQNSRELNRIGVSKVRLLDRVDWRKVSFTREELAMLHANKADAAMLKKLIAAAK